MNSSLQGEEMGGRETVRFYFWNFVPNAWIIYLTNNSNKHMSTRIDKNENNLLKYKLFLPYFLKFLQQACVTFMIGIKTKKIF